MGTKGSYTGGGGQAGKSLREGIVGWADGAVASVGGPRPHLSQSAMLPVAGLFRPRADGPSGGGGGGSSGGGGGGSGGGGAQRTIAASARVAGRAAAAAYGLRTGDPRPVQELGLDYDALRSNSNPLEVTKAIIDAACGPLDDGTVEDIEQRYVAAKITGWVLDSQAEGFAPTPDEIVRESIALIIFEAACSETAARLRANDRPDWIGPAAEEEMLATARVLAGNADLSATGATESELSKAIEQGMESLRQIWGG